MRNISAADIYKLLLYLFPARHRQAYGELMLLHACDLEREARQGPPARLAGLYLNLILDGLRSAAIERWEDLMNKPIYKPQPWLVVLLAAVPGLLISNPRASTSQFMQIVEIALAAAYLLTLLIGLPLAWRRQGRFPVWGLLPAGLLIWIAIYAAGNLLDQLLSSLNLIGSQFRGAPFGMVLLQYVLTAVLFVLLLRGRRLPRSAWIVLGVMLLINVISFFSYRDALAGRLNSYNTVFLFLTVSGILPVEGLLLAAVGLLAVRKHGLLAILVVIGGFGYMCLDSDYIAGFMLREWSGYTLYALTLPALYLVVTPVWLLRARSRLGRFLAVFLPVGLFHLARLVTPGLALPGPSEMPWGDIFLSLNVLLSLLFAWFLYDHLSHQDEATAQAALPASQPSTPLATDL